MKRKVFIFMLIGIIMSINVQVAMAMDVTVEENLFNKKIAAEFFSEAGLEVPCNARFSLAKAKVGEGNEKVTVLCMTTENGNLMEQSFYIAMEAKENGKSEVVDVTKALNAKAVDTSVAEVNSSKSGTYSGVTVTALYDRKAHNKSYYYQPYKLQVAVTSESVMTSIVAKYQIVGYPFDGNYKQVSDWTKGNFSINLTTSTPSFGKTYVKESRCPYNILFSGVPGTLHEVTLKFNGSTYTMALEQTLLVL